MDPKQIREMMARFLPLARRYGARTAVMLARSYLGPVACGTDRNDMDVLGLALSKLVYEAGELAMNNPRPDFKVDDKGCPPAVSLAHVVAATRAVRAYAAEREPAPSRTSPRARLEAARLERYARNPRYAYPSR